MSLVVAAVLVGCAAALLVPGGPTDPPRFWPLAGLPLFLVVPGPLLGAAGVLAAAALGAYVLLARRRRRVSADRYAAVVRDHCDLFAADLAAGIPVAVAFGHLAERWPEVQPVVEADRYGLDVPRAWESLAEDTGVGGLRLVAMAWRYAQQTGVGLAVAMRHVADGLRAQAQIDRTVAAELSSARATARLVALLPIAVLSMGSGLGGSPWHFLLMTTPGVVLLAVGLGLIWAGLWWLEAIIDGVWT